MNILVLLLFVSVVFMILAIVGFIYSVHMEEPDHCDYLENLPLEKTKKFELH